MAEGQITQLFMDSQKDTIFHVQLLNKLDINTYWHQENMAHNEKQHSMCFVDLNNAIVQFIYYAF